MPPRNRSDPMPVKYWSFAGLMLTDWCNARCASCYLSCGPQRNQWMSVDHAIDYWRQLQDASQHGCRIHLSGGEPFGDWPRLIRLCRRAHALGLDPPATVETNAFWATDRNVAIDRLQQLDRAGMATIKISADPYHQQFIPLARCRLLAEAARDVLGPQRVRVRWEDWLAEGTDMDALSESQSSQLLALYLTRGRERLAGRAAEEIAPRMLLEPLDRIADKPCNDSLLRSRHVHVDPDGSIVPGTCAGIVLGRIGPASATQLWQQLNEDWPGRPIVGRLARGGPVALARWAMQFGFQPSAGYAGRCHLCWAVRTFLIAGGWGGEELGPRWQYDIDPGCIGVDAG